ncbi:MAG TPA: hypothetical protein VFV49_09620 [Thermoanaerobaculia bacterium]|nr:hypothetical protein [Thermoanaerobaculia bacterium]
MSLRPWIAIVVVLLAATAQAAEPRIVFAPRRVLQAGEVVTVGWEGLPSGVDELEFLLVTDDGETVRLTPQLMPKSGSFGWTVPNLPSRAAVLELRAGGEDEEEAVLASSEPFEIRGVALRARVEFRDGEWWSVETGMPAAPPAGMHSIGRAGVPRAHLFLRPRKWLPPATMDLGEVVTLEQPEMSVPRADTRCGAPLIVPQRI